MTSIGGGIIVGAGEGKRLSLFGLEINIMALGEDTEGAYGMWNATFPGSMEQLPVHTHDKMAEAIYVLEGGLTVMVGEESSSLGAGGYLLVPKGVTHSFWNPAGEPAKVLTLASPGGWERNIETLAEALPGLGTPPDTARLNELLIKCDILPA